jgi:hypothetical protein
MVETKTKRNGCEILFASKQNRVMCFACFVSKRNGRYRIQDEKETKRNAAEKASKCETKISENTVHEAKLRETKQNFKAKHYLTETKY